MQFLGLLPNPGTNVSYIDPRGMREAFGLDIARSGALQGSPGSVIRGLQGMAGARRGSANES